MPLFRRFILRCLLQEKLRSAVTVLGIALGVAVVIAVRLANGSALRGFETALDTISGRTSLEVVGSGLGIEESRLADLGYLRAYGFVSPVIEGDVVAVGPAPGESGTAEMLHVLGIDVLRDFPLRDYSLLDAGSVGTAQTTARDLLDRLVDPETIILTEKYARRRGLAVGARVRLLVGDREREFVVRGLLRDEGPARVLDGNFALMDIAAAQWAFERLGYVDRLDIRLHDPGAIDRVEHEVSGRLPGGLIVQRPSRRGAQVEKMLAAFHLNLTALSYVSLLVGLFLVYTTVATSVIARRGEIGTLRALGVRRLHVLALFLGEAAVLSAVGCLAGVGLGRVLADAAVGLTSTTVTTLYIAHAAAPPALSWSDVAVALMVGVPLSLGAAALPALEASRVTPLDAIRGADRLGTRYRLRPVVLAMPLFLLSLGAWLATLPAVRGVPVAGFASAFALVLGAASCVPIVLYGLGRVGRLVLGRAFGVEGTLANANLAGAIPRLSVAVAALAVSLSMMVAIAIMIGSFRDTVVHWVSQTLRADLFVGPSTRGAGARLTSLSPDVERVVASHPSVAAIDRFRNVTVPYGGSQIVLVAGDFSVMLDRATLLFKAPFDARERMRGAIGQDVVVVSEAFANRYGRQVGDQIELTTPKTRQRFLIAAVYFDYSTDRGVVSMDRATFERHFGTWRPTGLTVYLEDGVDADAVRSELLGSLDAASRVFIYTNASLRREVLRIFDATFSITYALEVIAVLVAIMGVAGTLLTLVLERRREISILRLVGADRRQVLRMVVIEAGLLGAVSQGVALGVGVLLSLVLVFVINVQSFGWTLQFSVPWRFLLQMSAAIVVATAISGVYPARLASRLRTMEEVVEE